MCSARRRPLRVVFVSFHDFWPTILATGLNERFGDSLACETLVQGAGAGSIPSYVRALFSADIVVRVGATFYPDSTLDRLFLSLPRLRRSTPVVLYWIGTDVLTFATAAANGSLPGRLTDAIRRMTSFAGADHLADELAEAGVAAKAVPFPAPLLSAPDQAPPMPERFTVLTYLPVGSGERFEFYGGPLIVAAARALPDVRFTVMGTERIDGVDDLPPNVALLGRVENPSSAYAQASVVARIVSHDAIGGTVMEGLQQARHIVYTVPLPHTVTVPFGDEAALIAALRELKARHDAGTLGPNDEGREWAATEFDPDRRFAALADGLRRLAEDGTRS